MREVDWDVVNQAKNSQWQSKQATISLSPTSLASSYVSEPATRSSHSSNLKFLHLVPDLGTSPGGISCSSISSISSSSSWSAAGSSRPSSANTVAAHDEYLNNRYDDINLPARSAWKDISPEQRQEMENNMNTCISELAKSADDMERVVPGTGRLVRNFSREFKRKLDTNGHVTSSSARRSRHYAKVEPESASSAAAAARSASPKMRNRAATIAATGIATTTAATATTTATTTATATATKAAGQVATTVTSTTAATTLDQQQEESLEHECGEDDTESTTSSSAPLLGDSPEAGDETPDPNSSKRSFWCRFADWVCAAFKKLGQWIYDSFMAFCRSVHNLIKCVKSFPSSKKHD